MPTPPSPNEAIEIVKLALGPIGVLLGSGIALMGSWLTDRRRLRNEHDASDQQVRALLTGMFAVRNHIMQTLIDYENDGVASRLEPLRTAQSYVHRLIDKAPIDSERLMIVVFDIGLAIDSLLATLDRRQPKNVPADVYTLASRVGHGIERLLSSLEQFDIISQSELSMLSEDDLAQFEGYESETKNETK